MVKLSNSRGKKGKRKEKRASTAGPEDEVKQITNKQVEYRIKSVVQERRRTENGK